MALYAKLVRLDRPIGFFLVRWPALWVPWIAGEGSPPWQIARDPVAWTRPPCADGGDKRQGPRDPVPEDDPVRKDPVLETPSPCVGMHLKAMRGGDARGWIKHHRMGTKGQGFETWKRCITLSDSWTPS